MAPRGGLKVAALRSIWRFMFMKRASICLYIWGLDSSIAYQIKEMFDTHFQFWFCKDFLPEKETNSCFCALARAANDAWRISTIMRCWNFSANATLREQLIPEVLATCFQVKQKKCLDYGRSSSPVPTLVDQNESTTQLITQVHWFSSEKVFFGFSYSLPTTKFILCANSH